MNSQFDQAVKVDPRPNLWIFVALYFCEGAPIGFLWWALPTLLREEGVAVPRITQLAAVLALPWSFKFLVAPLVDCWRSSWWTFREWTLLTQLAMGCTLLPLIWLDWQVQFNWLLVCLIVHACCAAVQDCSIDAAAIHAVPIQWRGDLNGRMQAGMLLGRSLFGGGVLLISAWLDKWIVVVLLTSCIWGTMFVTRLLHVPVVPTHSLGGFVRHVVQAARQPKTWGGVAVALLAGAAFEATGALSGPLLLDQGLSGARIGFLFAVPVVVLTILGGLLGGRTADRFGIQAAMLGWLVLLASCVLELTWFIHGQSPFALPLLIGLWLAMYFCVGGFTATSYAWFMNLTDQRLGATQFSLYMSATNGCEVLSAKGAGALYPVGGYELALAVPALVSLLTAVAIGWTFKAPSITLSSDNATSDKSSRSTTT